MNNAIMGDTHDAEGNLVINPEEAPTVKLTFYMYLYGYSSQQIADTLIALERKSYLGNIKWTAGSVVQILRNERHCGDVVTRKTYTKDYHSHKKSKNHGQRPQSTYRKHHEAIVSRDDFIAVQRMLDNAKYGNKSVLPELRVIDSGILRGFVTINPRWAGFKEPEYYQASRCVYQDTTPMELTPTDEIQVSVEAGDFDLHGFEVSRAELFDVVIQDEHRIHRAADTRCAGEPVYWITVSLLSQMVYQQDGNTIVVSNPLQLLHILIVTSIGSANLSACLNDLSRKDTDRVFCLVGALCAEHERIAFFAGLQLGAQLMLELQQEAAGE